MKKLILASWLLILVTFSGQFAYACRCPEIPINGSGEYSLKEWLDEFDGAMFTGRVVKIIKVKADDEWDTPELRVTFRVDRFWKGVKAAETVIYTSAGTCGVRYVRGRKYFVIADNFEGRLRTDICTSPKSYDEVYDYIKELGEGKKPNGLKSRAQPNNGLHPTAGTTALMLRERCGAAGAAGR